jgi:3-oxoacyl-[acyl-carrier protein] reductase
MRRHTVIVSGATKGLGRAVALQFAQSGHQVLGFYASDEEAAAILRSDLQTLSYDFKLVKHDVSRECPEMWARPEIQQADSLVLINNACAPFTPKPFHLLNWEDCEESLRVSLKGSWLCSRALLKSMVRNGCGTIVNVLTPALQGLPPKGFAAYITAKHALRGLTLALASEYATKGIRVFSVSPGFMSTTLTAGWDARLLEIVRSRTSITDPTVAARKIMELVDGSAEQSQGEDYSL